MQDQGVADQGDEGGEGEDVLVAAAAMPRVEVVEELGLEQVGPGGQGGVGQGDARQDHGGEDVERELEVRGQEPAEGRELGGRIRIAASACSDVGSINGGAISGAGRGPSLGLAAIRRFLVGSGGTAPTGGMTMLGPPC